MKTITLITTVALSSLTAFATPNSATPTTTTAADKAAECCDKAKDGTCDDTCWLDIETITVEAANGNPIAQYTIAWLTDNGTENTPKDPEKAGEWYKKALPGLEKAAKEGDPTACRALARMYATGKGVEKNPEKAAEIMKWCKQCEEKKAADSTAPAPSHEAAADKQSTPAEM